MLIDYLRLDVAGSALPPSWLDFPAGTGSHPLFDNAIREVSKNLKMPHSVVATTALSTIAAATQKFIEVKLPTGSVKPVSLYALILVPSGGGKNTLMNLFAAPVEQYQERRKEYYCSVLSNYNLEQEIWDKRRKLLLKKAVSSGEPLDSNSLSEHDQTSPCPPKKERLIYEDATPEALMHSLHVNGSIGWLKTSEGGIILSGHSVKKLPALCQLWSGDSVTIDRVASESYELKNARLSALIMAQPGIFADFCIKYGKLARMSGFFARCLMASVPSNISSRYIDDEELSWDAKDRFCDRVEQCLSLNNGPSRLICFSPVARRRWVEMHNSITEQLTNGVRFQNAPDLAARIPENVARVAALLHCFEGWEGDITLETINYAIQICFWHAEQFLTLMSESSRDEVDAEKLLGWFAGKYRNNGQVSYLKNFIRQHGPNSIRDSERLDAAINYLNARLQITCWRRPKGSMAIEYHPGRQPYYAL